MIDTDGGAVDAPRGRAAMWTAAVAERAGRLDVQGAGAAPDLTQASHAGVHCVVQGFAYGLPNGETPYGSHAERLLQAYLARGEPFVDDLAGFFSFVMWDERAETLLAARDPLGIHPLFYARGADGLVLSPSIAALVERPDVAAAVNRLAVADHLRHRWFDAEETYFEAVRRIPSGHVLTHRRGFTTTRRYWDPLFPGQEPEWISADELTRFDDLLDASIDRLSALGRPAVYLSGGLDSVTVAALAADRARRQAAQDPLALSLAFPEPFDESGTQTRVAGDLGLPLQLHRLADVLGEGGLVRAAMRQADLSAPLQNPWLAAYRALAGEARAAGCEVVLTGSGGDEWLTVTPMYGADLLRSLRLREFARLVDVQRRSYTVSTPLFLRNMLWRFGARPVLTHEWQRIRRQVAPGRFEARALDRARDGVERWPWLAPDPELRAQLAERDVERVRRRLGGPDLSPVNGPRHYFRECREALEHPLVSMEAEEVFEYSRRAGVRVLHPFWDTKLVEFLHATPPELLNRGGRAKGLIREMLERRFPGVGFERQRKVITASFFAWSVAAEAPAVWREIGEARALADAGIIDLQRCRSMYAPREVGALQDGRPVLVHQQTDPMWEILVLEAWMRPRL